MELESLFKVKRAMTPKEGFEKVKKHLGNKRVRCGACRDYGSDFMFFTASKRIDKSKRVFTGAPLIVNKKSGKVYEYGDIDLSGKEWEFVDMEG